MYADDIALVTESEEGMQEALEIVDMTFQKWGLNINIQRTQVMKLASRSEEQVEALDLKLRGESVAKVQHFKYLGNV